MSTFVLVHGGGHRSWHWNLVAPLLRDRGHQVITPEVPMDSPGAGAADWADAIIADLATAGNPDDVILVGHSLSGLAIPVVAATYPLERLVFLCANVPEVGRSYENYLAEHPTAVIMPPITLDQDGCLELSWPDARRLYYGDCEESLALSAWEHLVRSAALTAFTETSPLQAWPTGTPTSYILCTEDEIIGPDWSREVCRTRLQITPIELPGSHSPMLSRPSELVDALCSLADSSPISQETTALP
ncbi:hypothetical protein ASC77_23740 [Nocardioides sp. Root1257]|uniref:alpha/beta fold hydrolase n=1 Tax=unclassified Nocardioides TaxID=2615069 RepID=UPI0006F1D62B|nr:MULTISPECIES: alpha/beta hydrolase [unclassified Nocardioides]KQW42674.1 hypothetical protein ASC77_23740 [Nocardioides sp. Root1257]KRC39932.1 hypothetical protein ASE24_23535 [Nocardioides sp. Root224]